jgi:polysaccharide export outer membrane protein
MFRHVLVSLGVLLCLSVILAGNEAAAKAYRIGVADVLHISVCGQPDLDKHVTVFDDGTISFPLINRVPAKGLTVMELTKNITDLLEKDYLVSPR